MTLLSASLLLFIILDPLGNLPVFNHLLASVPAGRRRRIILRECLIALGVLLLFLLAGRPIMGVLGLEQPTLSIGGGIILFLIALKMVFPEHGVGTGKGEVKEEPFIVPLAVPLFAGPSALAFVLLLTSNHPGRTGEWVAAVGIAWLASALILLASDRIEKWLGPRFLRAMEKLAGMLLILLAIQMVLNGIPQLDGKP
jgi:MarC family membrane protein